MSYYFIANIKIEDQLEYQKYINKVDEVFFKYNGKYLAVDDNPKIIEGKWNYSRVVVIEFKTEQDFNKWYESNDYQEILRYRINASYSDTVLIKGK
ncbi:MAG: DUF1330 domain-containing protein [Ignavibacteria bacterium]|nr:DUF1330 domain-containing protein [Ignavibacteria bacterium]MBT8391119.1 DUF1330 domain-containing protein [Ignavibacteria bacterium]NNJ53002.1 DUF1330 domain-containing protein [Ignavibacteriaceae bacterium]NNL19996.1 DUF1330 domain-containing protein [Ignavibacteriaceae bacterium]